VEYPSSVCALPYKCEVGTGCPDGAASCNSEDDCAKCGMGEASLGTEPCARCDEQGKVANSDQSVCQACTAGGKPNEQRSRCTDCTGNTASPYGISCDPCPGGSATNAGHTNCDDLSAKDNNGEAIVQITSAATAAQVLEGSSLLPQVTMEIQADPAVLVEGSVEQMQFLQDLAAEMAAALGIDISDVEIIGVRPTVDGGDHRLHGIVPPGMGRRRLRRRLETAAIEFDFVIRSADPAAAMAQLESQLADETSLLRTSDNLGTVDPEGTLAFTFTCAAGFHRPAGAADCKRCGGNNEYPDPDDNTRCLVCQDPMTVKDDGSGCRCADAHYDARAELLVCYEVGESWLATDFKAAPAKDAAEPQCLPCSDCLTCKDGSAKVAKGYMVSEADKAVAAGSTSTCGRAPSCSLISAWRMQSAEPALVRAQWPIWTSRGLRVPPRGVHRNSGVQRDAAG
jgi:hypothetical protein